MFCNKNRVFCCCCLFIRCLSAEERCLKLKINLFNPLYSGGFSHKNKRNKDWIVHYIFKGSHDVISYDVFKSLKIF